MTTDTILYGLGGVAIAAAAVVVFGRNLLYNVLGFTVVLLASAGLFAALGSSFLAVVQVFLYVGGVVVLILFGLMMTASTSGEPVCVDSRHSFSSAVAAVALAAMLIPLVGSTMGAAPARAEIGGTPAQIGRLLLTTYALPFEVVGLVLLVAAVAAIVIVRRGEAE